MLDQKLTESGLVNVSLGQGLVEAAVRSAELRFQAEGGHRPHRGRRAQCGVTELEEGISPRGQALVE
jgi:metal-dependent amidase/aminoacylase/carboxypeptidase family protein